LDLAPTAMRRLNALKRRTEATSYVEVVRNALRLYEALLEEREAGRQLFTRSADGAETALKVFEGG